MATRGCPPRGRFLPRKTGPILGRALLAVKKAKTSLVDLAVVHQVRLSSRKTSTPPALRPTTPLQVRPQLLDRHRLEEGFLVTLMFSNQHPTHLANLHRHLLHPIPIPPLLVHSMVHNLNKSHQISTLRLTLPGARLPTLHPINSSRRHPTPPQALPRTVSRTVPLVVALWQASRPIPIKTA